MNRKGFTLIELLATIVLLAMIAMIAIPAVNGVLSNNKQKNCETLKESIIRAATLYVSDNKYTLAWDYNNQTTVPLGVLYNSVNLSNTQYLNSRVKNPCDNSAVADDSISVIFKNKNNNIEFVQINLPSDFTCCNEAGENKQ